MKHCSYFYKGKEIGDVKALDDFLLEKQKWESTLGDLIFQYTPNQLAIQSIIKKVNKLQEKLNKEYAKAKQNARMKAALYGESEEEVLRMERPYVGVSEFLCGQVNNKGKLYFPEFIPSNYWSNRYYAWSKGEFTNDEKELFFNNDNITNVPLGNTSDWRNSDGVLKDDFGTEEQKRLRDLMIDKWENQAKLGNEVHAVLQKYFSTTKSGKYWYELLEDQHSGNMHKANFVNNLREKDSKNNSKISEAITDKMIEDILSYAKELKSNLELQYIKPNSQDKLLFYPEFTLSANLNKEYEGRTDLELLGRIDLLVIDSEGTPHIIDYKTSPKTYEEYNSPKKLNFTYQLATYERMLRRWGFNTTNSDVSIAPLKMENFRKENDKWIFDGVVKGTTEKEPLRSLNDKLTENYLNQNLDEFIEAPLIINSSSENLVSSISDIMAKIFPKYGDNKKKTDEEIRQLIQDQDGFQISSESGLYEYLPKGHKIPITATKEEGEGVLFKRVKEFYINTKNSTIKKTTIIAKALKKSQNTGEAFTLPQGIDNWVVSMLSKYANPEWEVLDDDNAKSAQQFGLLLLYNKTLDILEPVKISMSNAKYMNSFGSNNQNLFGAHEVDINENSRSNTLILKAANGNVELMESMLILNNLNFNKTVQIGGIQVINPFSDALGLTASNKELMYNWKKLIHFSKGLELNINDKFANKQIKLLSDVEKCYFEFQDILARVDGSKKYVAGNFDQLKPLVNDLYQALIPNNVEEVLASLEKLKKELEKNFQSLTNDIDNEGNSIHSNIQNYDQQYSKTLYQIVNKAILDLNNFNIRQTLEDHHKLIQSTHILQKGLSGTYTDNAMNFGNELLNQISALALEGYQNARDLATNKLLVLRNKVEELKKDLGFSGFIEHTYGNQTSLYDGMTYYSKNGNLLFVNPWKNNHNLSPKQAEFLKFIILEINKNTHNYSQEEINDKIKYDDITFFQVPLIEGTFASKIGTDGWANWLKQKLKIFTSLKNFKQFVKDKQTEFFSEEDEASTKNKEIFKVVSLMDQGTGSKRLDVIQRQRQKYGDGYFERDLERLLSSHIWAYATKNALTDRMPLIKAAYISLAVMGNTQNFSFSNDLEFIKEFTQNKINHQSIVDEKFKELKGTLGIVQQAASWMALAFSPVQMTYQSLEGIWKDIKLMITKPDGTETFSLNNFKNSAKIVYDELFHLSDKPTVTTAINAFYGINDMDNASFAENNTSNRHGFFNFFNKFAYKFSSRPDFYNRMTIFVAQMQQDGSWEAHSINQKTNELEYDWKLDKRFQAYVIDRDGKNGKTEEWQQAKAMYYAVAQQLVREGARNKNGSLFTIGDPLPKAYSNKESEAKKAVGDNIYGYYDSTKKSLMQATLAGGLIMQMRTYWSAKKNQYLAPGGVKAQGKWIHAEQEFLDPISNEYKKSKVYYAKTKEGEIDLNGPLVPEWDENKSDVPFLQWQGKFEEGVLITAYGLLKTAFKTSWGDAWNSYWNNTDENLRKAYRANLKLGLCDFLLWAIIGSAANLLGDWADDESKKAKKSGHFEDALGATFAGLIYRTVYNSSLDTAWWHSIFDISMDFNPFAFTYIGNEAKVLTDFIFDDNTFSETIVKSFSAARQLRPIFTYIDQEE